MAVPTTKEAFKEYCLRSLGKPVIEINVADTQTDDRIDEAIQYYQLFHMDAVDRMLMTHTITQDDLDNEYLTIPEPVMTVTRMIWGGAGITTGDFASDAWQFQANIFAGLGFSSGVCRSSTPLSDYAISMQNLSNASYLLNNYPTVQYSSHSNRLFIEDDWSRWSLGDTLAYEAYVIIDPTVHIDIWNDVWLKEYATALIGRQWGRNLQKFQQVELPGGIVLDGDGIFNQYNEEITKLKEEMELRYEFPPDFDVG